MAEPIFTCLLRLRVTPALRDAVAAQAAVEQRPVAAMARLLIERALAAGPAPAQDARVVTRARRR